MEERTHSFLLAKLRDHTSVRVITSTHSQKCIELIIAKSKDFIRCHLRLFPSSRLRGNLFSVTVFAGPCHTCARRLLVSDTLTRSQLAPIHRLPATMDTTNPRETGQTNIPPYKPCWNFIDTGTCRFGAKCKFAHIASALTQVSTSQPSTSKVSKSHEQDIQAWHPYTLHNYMFLILLCAGD